MKSHIPAVNALERIEIPHDEVDELKEFRLASSTSNMRKRGRELVAKVLKEQVYNITSGLIVHAVVTVH